MNAHGRRSMIVAMGLAATMSAGGALAADNDRSPGFAQTGIVFPPALEATLAGPPQHVALGGEARRLTPEGAAGFASTIASGESAALGRMFRQSEATRLGGDYADSLAAAVAASSAFAPASFGVAGFGSPDADLTALAEILARESVGATPFDGGSGYAGALPAARAGGGFVPEGFVSDVELMPLDLPRLAAALKVDTAVAGDYAGSLRVAFAQSSLDLTPLTSARYLAPSARVTGLAEALARDSDAVTPIAARASDYAGSLRAAQARSGVSGESFSADRFGAKVIDLAGLAEALQGN